MPALLAASNLADGLVMSSTLSTVQLFILSTLSDQTVKDSMIAGMFTRNNGDFVVALTNEGQS